MTVRGCSQISACGLREPRSTWPKSTPLQAPFWPNLPFLSSLDGLTYDPYSGLLYASSVFGNTVYSIDPNNLNNVQDLSRQPGTVFQAQTVSPRMAWETSLLRRAIRSAIPMSISST